MEQINKANVHFFFEVQTNKVLIKRNILLRELYIFPPVQASTRLDRHNKVMNKQI